MLASKFIWRKIPVTTRYRSKIILLIALSWTVIDILYLLVRIRFPDITAEKDIINYDPAASILLRAGVVFLMSSIMASILFLQAQQNKIELPLWINFLLKTVMLICLALVMNFLIHFTYDIIILKRSVAQSFRHWTNNTFYEQWIIKKIPGWLLIFVLLQVIIEMIKKYSPGIFFDVLFGKYRHPKVEKRIVMFIDLKDSTPIAEKLGHVEYFLFIREFIEIVSTALLQFNGRIYQYVGDEVVVSWMYDTRNAKRCMDSLIETRKQLQKHSEDFRRKFDISPEFRVGIHIGEVTVGEIGVMKKDLAMSGDTMNVTARIRSACSELNHKFIVSKEVIDSLDLKEWQSESLGNVDLKGKNEGVELYALKI